MGNYEHDATPLTAEPNANSDWLQLQWQVTRPGIFGTGLSTLSTGDVARRINWHSRVNSSISVDPFKVIINGSPKFILDTFAEK
jgi:hypothetical protein